MLKRLRSRWQRQQRERALLTLMQVALETPALGMQLKTLLAHPPATRSALIHTWCTEMQLQSAPTELVSALRLLSDDRLAERAAKMIDTTLEVEDHPPHGRQ